MRQLILYIIFLISLVFSDCGKISAASVLPHQDSYTSAETNKKKDGLAAITPKQDKPDAQLEDASIAAYRACSNRPQRLLPSGNILSNQSVNKLPFNRIRFLLSLFSSLSCGEIRTESAPIHFDVACKYYVICLRHLRC